MDPAIPSRESPSFPQGPNRSRGKWFCTAPFEVLGGSVGQRWMVRLGGVFTASGSTPPLIRYFDPFNIGIWITKNLTLIFLWAVCLRTEITPFTNQTQANPANNIDLAPIMWEIQAPWVPHQKSHGQPQIPRPCISFWIQVGSLYYSDLFHRKTHIKRPTSNSLCCLRPHKLLRNGADIIPTPHIKGPNLPRSFQMRFSYPIIIVKSPHYQSNPWCPDGILK